MPRQCEQGAFPVVRERTGIGWITNCSGPVYLVPQRRNKFGVTDAGYNSGVPSPYHLTLESPGRTTTTPPSGTGTRPPSRVESARPPDQHPSAPASPPSAGARGDRTDVARFPAAGHGRPPDASRNPQNMILILEVAFHGRCSRDDGGGKGSDRATRRFVHALARGEGVQRGDRLA